MEHDPRGFLGFVKRAYGRLVDCPRGNHRRSAREAVLSGDEYISSCLNCGVPMVRVSKRNWVVDPRRS